MRREVEVVLRSLAAGAAIVCAGCGARPGASPPAPPRAATFFCSFASSPSDCGFTEQAKAPGRANVVAVGLAGGAAGRAGLRIGRDGPTSVRLHTEPGDSNVAGSLENERDDLALSQAATDCYEGREQWWAHSILFPDDYVDPPPSSASAWNWATVFDFHNSRPGAGQANFQINAWPASAMSPDRPTGLAFQIAYGDQARPTVKSFPVGPLVRNVWYDFVYHVKWSSGPDGFFTAWVDGSRKMDYRGPTLYAGQGCYLKLANYHTPFGKPSSVLHDRVIRGANADSVSAKPLEGIVPAR
ncbi:MAG TPA: heparin lyase I family protein [Burkholderiales bacterium]|nr:heparin lyase I family protein [Burkholderiales bacterium]